MTDRNFPPMGTKLDRGTLMHGLLGLFLMGLAFFSGFISLGTYVFSKDHASFLSRAIETKARVTNVEQKKRVVERTGSNNRTRTSYKYDDILTLEFVSDSGERIVAKINDGSESVYSANEEAAILYDSENPQRVLLKEDKDRGGILRIISKVSFVVFLISVAAFFYFGKRKSKSTTFN